MSLSVRPYAWYILPVFFLLVLMGGLFWQVQQIDIERDQRLSMSLEHIATLDNQVEENMLSLSLRHVRHFDVLGELLNETDQVLARLREDFADEPQWQEDVHALAESVRQQSAAADAFRRSMGVLRNSERYLPQWIDAYIQENPQHREWLLALRADLFQWLAQKDDRRLRQRLERDIRRAREMSMPVLARHLTTILRYSERVETAMQQAIDCGIVENAGVLLQRVRARHMRLMHQQKVQRIWLQGLTLLCLVYLLGLVISRQRMANRLRESNSRLIEMERRLMRDLAEKAQAEARYHTLLNTIPDGVGVHRHGRWLYLNQAALDLFHASSAEELIGTEVIERVHPEQREVVLERIRKEVEQGSPAPLMLQRNLRLDGSVFYGEVQGMPFVDVDGEGAVLVVVRDVTARIEAEEASRRLRVALDQAAEGVFITDAEGKVIYANEACSKLTGLRPEHMLGRYASELRGGAPGDMTYREILDSMRAGKTWEGEFTFLDAQGRQHTVVRKVSPVVNELGEVKYHVGMDFDVTEERALRSRIEHTQRLESLGILAGGIAHDFNNILMAIMGNACMARMQVQEGTELHECLRRIEKASERAADLCRQMLAYSGKGHFVVRPIHLPTLVREISDLMKVSMRAGVRLHRELAQDTPMIDGDVAQLQQVVLNLITNANEAMGEEGGEIHLRIERVWLSEEDIQRMREFCPIDAELPSGEYVLLQVRDTGCGMDEHTRSRLFEPFFTTKFTGRGLGMSAVLGIVRSHRGLLWIDTAPGKGTSFSIYFPVSAKKTPSV